MITAYQACLNFLTNMKKFPGKKILIIPEPLLTAPKVTQDQDDMGKDDKVSISIEGSRQESLCVSPHPLLNTPPPFDNKQDYKGDTHDETPDPSTKYNNVLKKDNATLKRNLDKETKTANDDEYVDYEQLKFENIKSQTQ